jgi:nitrate/nitrite-specific signal transduction histidine kinase
MKFSTKLYLAIFMQFIVSISLVSILLYMQAKQKHDSLVINLAGRQRMLSQKITKEILLFSEGYLSSENIANTIDVFRNTLKSLNHGGKAPLDLAQTQFAELPRPSSKKVVDQLQKVEAIWGGYQKNALEVLAEKDQPALEQIKEINATLIQEMKEVVDQLQKVESTWKLFRENTVRIIAAKNQLPLEHIKKINVPLLQEMNKAVFLMDQEAAKKVRFVRYFLLVGCAVLVALLLFTVRIILQDRQADRPKQKHDSKEVAVNGE